MLEELRKKAKEKADLLNNDPNADQDDKEFANDIVEFFSKEEGIKQAPQSLLDSIFTFLGYPRKVDVADKMYKELMEDIDRVYYYVNIDETMTR